RVLLGLATFYFIRGELETSRELGAQCLPMVERLSDAPRLLQAHLGLGSTLFHMGELAAARQHLEAGVAGSQSTPAPSRPPPAVADPQVVCLSYAAKTYWVLGLIERAEECSQRALALAQELAHPYTQAIAVALSGWFLQMCGEESAAQVRAESGIALSRE